MATIDSMKAAVQIVAATRYSASAEEGGPVMIALGPPGAFVEIASQRLVTGSSWGEDKTLQVLLQGVADYLDAQGIGSVSGAVGKLNELIAAYNQLRADYNASVAPTTAPAVLPLP